jgi:RNA polymerase sigma-70 factor, ECF subfamily
MTGKRNLDSAKVSRENKARTDNELVVLIREKKPDLYGEIIERYRGKLFAYIYRLIGNRDEAEDLLQDVFIKVYKNLNSFDAERKFSSWIYRIAHNEAVNRIKRKSLKQFISWEDISSTKDKLGSRSTEAGADDAWIKKESMNEVDEIVNKLPMKYKQVLLLRYFSDKSYEEIGEILDKPVNTIGTLINRAKKKLAEEMKKITAKQNKERKK